MKIHDHFDGSAHCVQCAGHCRLTGDDLAVTRLIRYTLERLVFIGWKTIPPLELDALKDLGIDPNKFMSRAVEAAVLRSLVEGATK